MGHEYTNQEPPHSCIREKFVDGLPQPILLLTYG